MFLSAVVGDVNKMLTLRSRVGSHLIALLILRHPTLRPSTSAVLDELKGSLGASFGDALTGPSNSKL